MKPFSVYCTYVAKKQLTKIHIAIAANLDSNYSQPVLERHFQSTEHFVTDRSVNPPTELNLELNQLFRHLKTLYGVKKSDNYCGTKLQTYL